jgi:hypothetical protein
MDSTILLTSSVVAGISAALLNGYYNRRAAKKIPKTEMRADAYRDLVIHFVSGGWSSRAAPANNGNASLVEIKARLLLFGESHVVGAVSNFLNHHQALNTDSAVQEFGTVICEMRKSLLTGYKNEVSQSIKSILLSGTSGDQRGPADPGR